MARDFFKNLPDKTTPLNARRMNGFFNGEEAMGSIVVDDIKSKNLFNPLNVVNLFPNEDVFGVATGEYTFYVECEPSTAYSIQRISANTSGLIVCCSSEKPASDVSTINTNNFGNISKLENYITPNNAKYLCVRINPGSGTATLEEIKKTFQIEKGSTITPYTPYKNFSNEVYCIDVNINSVNGSYQNDLLKNAKYIVCNFYSTTGNWNIQTQHLTDGLSFTSMQTTENWYVGSRYDKATGTITFITRSENSNTIINKIMVVK